MCCIFNIYSTSLFQGTSSASSVTSVAATAAPAVTSAADTAPTPAASQAAASAAAAQSSSTPSAAAAFTLPGKKLSVLPIGLGVFAGISVIALIVVGLVTYERTKYRKVRFASSFLPVGYFTDMN